MSHEFVTVKQFLAHIGVDVPDTAVSFHTQGQDIHFLLEAPNSDLWSNAPLTPDQHRAITECRIGGTLGRSLAEPMTFPIGSPYTSAFTKRSATV